MKGKLIITKQGELLKDYDGTFHYEMESLAGAEFEVTAAEDIYTAEKALAGLNLNQNQYDALVSFVYNIGVGAFKDSTIRKFLVKGDFDLASTQFQRWNKVTKGGVKIVNKGLTNRRAREKELFEKPVGKRI